jgi:hypothetical protein
MRTEDPEMRCAPGEYYITPQSKPEHSPADNKPYFEVDGWRIWGGPKARVRLRKDNWIAADLKLRLFEDGDNTWLKTHQQKATPAVVVSKRLDDGRLAEAERAVARLPLDKDNIPDGAYKLDEGIKFALDHGWDPAMANVMINDVCKDVRASVKRRSELPWNNKGHLARPGSAYCTLNHCERIFGGYTVGDINSAKYQESVLDAAAGELDNYKQLALRGLGRVLNFLLKAEKILFVRMHKFGLKSDTIPQTMGFLESQEYQDVFWDTALAAASVARSKMGLRPESDLKKSKAKTPWGLKPDLRYYLVPNDSKTGYRPVETTPLARILFGILKRQNRLGKLNEHGNYQLYIGYASSWSYWYIKMGYGEAPPNRVKQMLRRLSKLSDEDAVAEFYKQYPRKYKNGNGAPSCETAADGKVTVTAAAIHAYLEDSPRSGCISGYVHVTDGMVDAAATRFGNSRPIILEHYLALMSRARAFLSYQIPPTQCLAEIDPRTVALPSFAKPELLTAEDRAEMEALLATLPKFDPSALSLRAKTEAIRGEAIRRSWALRKSSPDWEKLRKEYQARARHARVVRSTRLKAKASVPSVISIEDKAPKAS